MHGFWSSAWRERDAGSANNLLQSKAAFAGET
jgi:hypothetical protein